MDLEQPSKQERTDNPRNVSDTGFFDNKDEVVVDSKKKIEIDKEKEEREVLEEIEKLPLLSAEKLDLALSYLGEKPVSEFTTHYNPKVPEEEKKALEVTKKLEKLFQKGNLFFEKLEKEQKKVVKERLIVTSFIVAKDEETLRELNEAFKSGDYKTIGKLFGYPETATEAFANAIKDKKLIQNLLLDEKEWWWKELTEEERNEFLGGNLLGFFSFRFSKEHWREELETIKRWNKVIEEKAPNLLKEAAKNAFKNATFLIGLDDAKISDTLKK